MSFLTLTLPLFLLGSPPADGRVLLDEIVASVNDDIIIRSELETAVGPFLDQNPTPDRRKRLYRDILSQLVNEKLMAQQIDDAKINVSEPELKAAIGDILRQNKLTEDQLLEALKARGMTMSDYEEDVRNQLIRLKLVDMKVRSRVVVPEADIRAEYALRTQNDEPETKVELAHILLRFDEGASEEAKAEVVERAKAIRSRVVDDNEDFGALAKELSQGPTASKGGSLGELETGSLLPELARAVKPLEPGDISPPVLTPNGVHIVRLGSRRAEPTRSFESMRDEIYQELFQRRVDEQMTAWLAELERSSAVDIRLDDEEGGEATADEDGSEANPQAFRRP